MRFGLSVCWALLIWVFCCGGTASAQELPPEADTLLVVPEVSPILDSLVLASPSSDTLRLDSTLESKDELDTTIAYSARSIEFFVSERRTLLTGEAQVRYKGMLLKAAQITVDWDNNLVIAEGKSDTLWADSAATQVDTVVSTGRPIFTEGDQDLTGEKMVYNLKTRRGRITEGTTAYQDGYYWGGALKKETAEVLYGGPASFTTCNAQHPHFTFRSQQMKMVVDDKVVAKPVVLYFSKVPVAAIPYGVFPSRKGRQSGLIIPVYGESAAQGRYLRHLGYYFAPNDYSDFTGSMDYYEQSGFLFRGSARYNLRYHFSGTLESALARQHFATLKKRRWELKWIHDQQIDPDTRLGINANFISDKSYYQEYSFNLNEQLSQTLRSDATLSHTFPGGKNSMSANLHHEQNLQTDEITQEIPRVSFRRGQSAIFPAPKAQPDDTMKIEPRWYNSIYYSYSLDYLHRRVLDQVIASGDTSLVQDRRSAAKHTLNLNSPQKISYFSFSPGLNYTEQWFDEYKDYSNTLAGEKVIGFRARRTFSTSLGFNTKLYGYWLNPIPGVEAIRHTATPNLSLSFQPDFSDPAWGYFQEVTEVTDSTETTYLKDRFAGSLYGSTPANKVLGLNFQLSNLFQMKYGSGEEKKKVDLFTLNFSTGYNFVADSLNFSQFTTNFRASPISGAQPVGPLKTLSLDASTAHSFYKYGTNSEYNEFYFDPQKGKILRLKSFDLSVNSGLALGSLVHSAERIRADKDTLSMPLTAATMGLDTSQSAASAPQLPREWYLGRVPWNLQLSFHYTVNRVNPNNPSETFWFNASVDASITERWQISYNTRVDLVEHKVVSAGLTLYRDLHCWEARLIWNPLGIGQGYYLKINIKSPQLQDVKVERRQGQGSFMGF